MSVNLIAACRLANRPHACKKYSSYIYIKLFFRLCVVLGISRENFKTIYHLLCIVLEINKIFLSKKILLWVQTGPDQQVMGLKLMAHGSPFPESGPNKIPQKFLGPNRPFSSRSAAAPTEEASGGHGDGGIDRRRDITEMKTVSLGASRPSTVNFRMPTRDNLVPIRVDLEVDGQRYRDAFTWNPRDPDSEIISFAKRTAKDLKLPANFVPQMLQSIQGQLAEFRSYEGQEMQIKEKIVPLKIDLRVNNTVIRDQFLWDIGNLDSDPEEFARTLCDDLNITDPEVGPAIAVSIREQLYEIASQSVSVMREKQLSKKGRRAPEFSSNSKAVNNAVDLFKYFGSKGSVIRKRKEWYLYEPVVDVVANEEGGKEEPNNSSRPKKRAEEEKVASLQSL